MGFGSLGLGDEGFGEFGVFVNMGFKKVGHAS